MNNSQITIGEITEMNPGNRDNPVWINGEFEAVVSNVQTKQTRNGKTYYTCTLADPYSQNIAIDCTCWSNLLSNKGGTHCLFGGQGIQLELYNNNVKLVIGDKARINVVGQTQGQSQPQQRQGGYQQRQQPHGQQRQQQTQPATINGQTVGMAINNSMQAIGNWQYDQTWYDSPEFSRTLHQMASDIIRVSAMLEKGKLAPSPKDREEPEPAPPPQQNPQQFQQQNPGMQPPMDITDDDVPFN